MFCRKVHLPIVNVAKRWHLLQLFRRQINVIVGLKLLTTGTNLTTVMYAEKEIKFGLKLGRMDIVIATHTYTLLVRKKPEH